jgi:hypothetical protein
VTNANFVHRNAWYTLTSATVKMCVLEYCTPSNPQTGIIALAIIVPKPSDPLQDESVSRNSAANAYFEGRLTLLSQKQSISLLQRNAVPRVLIIWRESRRVCGLGDFASNDLLQRVDTLARGIESVHKMHLRRL